MRATERKRPEAYTRLLEATRKVEEAVVSEIKTAAPVSTEAARIFVQGRRQDAPTPVVHAEPPTTTALQSLIRDGDIPELKLPTLRALTRARNTQTVLEEVAAIGHRPRALTAKQILDQLHSCVYILRNGKTVRLPACRNRERCVAMVFPFTTTDDSKNTTRLSNPMRQFLFPEEELEYRQYVTKRVQNPEATLQAPQIPPRMCVLCQSTWRASVYFSNVVYAGGKEPSIATRLSLYTVPVGVPGGFSHDYAIRVHPEDPWHGLLADCPLAIIGGLKYVRDERGNEYLNGDEMLYEAPRHTPASSTVQDF